MIIVHENLEKEALEIADAFRRVYGLSSRITSEDLGSLFKPIPAFNGFWTSHGEIEEFMRNKYGEKRVMVVTPRDIYGGNKNQDDDWWIGYVVGNLTGVSNARLKCPDNRVSSVLEVPEDLYLKRLKTVAVHELAHQAICGPHHKQASWVNARTSYEVKLGSHCTDNRCGFYEFIDIKTPPPEEGHLLLGGEKKFDAGLDDIISRLHQNWLCEQCLAHMNIDDSFL